MASFSSLRSDVFSREHRRQHYGSHIMGLNAYDRHKKFMDDYVNHYRREDTEGSAKLMKTDMDTLRENYRFIRTDEDDIDGTWEQRLAKRYYDKLFKEYCIADMSRYKEGKIGLRWRSEKEVVSGKGQFICGNKSCNEKIGLRSYEVNFAYKESGESRQALVKLRVCPRCAYKLNYKKEKELESQIAKEQKRSRKRRRQEKLERKSLKSDSGDAQSEDTTSSEDLVSEGSDGKREVASGRSRGALKPYGAGSPSLGGGTTRNSRSPKSPKHSGNEEFERFFDGMFL